MLSSLMHFLFQNWRCVIIKSVSSTPATVVSSYIPVHSLIPPIPFLSPLVYVFYDLSFLSVVLEAMLPSPF